MTHGKAIKNFYETLFNRKNKIGQNLKLISKFFCK